MRDLIEFLSRIDPVILGVFSVGILVIGALAWFTWGSANGTETYDLTPAEDDDTDSV